MRTIVYEETTNKKMAGWWWANADNHRQKHGPFDTKEDAEDAARAAKITAAAQHFKLEPHRADRER